jgi:plasmid stabilization system protein ParE
MAKRVEVMDAAIAEAAEAVDWYAERDRDAAMGFAEECTEAIRLVGQFSGSIAGYLHGTKRQLFKRYPYQLVFRELPGSVEVVAVAHLHRKPGYWKARLK